MVDIWPNINVIIQKNNCSKGSEEGKEIRLGLLMISWGNRFEIGLKS